MTYKLLIVDDEMPNLRLLQRLFSSDYECFTAATGAEAVQVLQRHDIAVLITDQRMPQMTGIDLLKQTAELRPHMVRILLTGYSDVEAHVEAINSGLVYMYITKPWNNSDLKLRVVRALEHYENNKKRHALALANERLESQLKQSKVNFASALAEALRMKDEYEYDHAMRVRDYAQALGDLMRLSNEQQTELATAALLHNVGLIGIRDNVLLKSAALTEEEEEEVKTRATRGPAIIHQTRGMQSIADIVRSYQENFDGSGYPGRTRGEDIPLLCRILHLADELDRLTQPRDPALAISHEAAVENLRQRAGREFDPNLVSTLGRLDETHFTARQQMNNLHHSMNPQQQLSS